MIITRALDGYPAVLIAAWLGHADAAFTPRTYTHSRPVVLAAMAGARSMNARGNARG